MAKFKQQLSDDFVQQLEHIKNMLLAPLLNPDANDNESLREKFKENPLLDSFKVIYDILEEMKREACKTLPTTSYLVNFSDITMNAFAVIQKDELMSSIFHLLISIAPFKVLKIEDAKILKYLGFQKAVDEMISGASSDTTNITGNDVKKTLDQAVASKTKASDSNQLFPKCKYYFFR